MITKTYNLEQFISEMQDFASNSQSYNGYSREALFEMYHYLTDMGAGDIEFDPIAFHCTFTELSIEDIVAEYENINSIEDLQDHTMAIELDNGNVLFDYNF